MIRSHRRREALIIALAVGMLPLVSLRSQTSTPEVDANGNTLARSSDVELRDPILSAVDSNENLIVAVSNETSSESDQADKLAKQLANPISSLISVPFQANEDFGLGPSHNGYKFTLNIQPVIPISISRDWNLIVRTIFPIVSQHDLFYIENLPKSSPLGPQNRSQDGLSDTTQSFFFSPKEPGPFGLIRGLGPAFLYPTGTHPFLGTGTFGIGPTLVVLKQEGPGPLARS